MDGFRDRLSGRHDRTVRNTERERYDRGMDDRYDRQSDEYDRDDRYDRYDRGPSRREGLSINAIADAVDKSNDHQLAAIEDMFEDARADRLESEKAIISAISERLAAAPAAVITEGAEEEEAAESNSDSSDTLARIERMASQNAESLTESSEMLERSVNSLRSNTELLNEIRGSLAEIKTTQDVMKSQEDSLSQNIQQSLYEVSQMAQSPVQTPVYAADNDNSREEILSAVGDNRALLNMIRQDMLNAQMQQSAQTEEEAPAGTVSPEMAEKYYKDLEEHVHKECVKCYRNVQSALTEQNTEAQNKLTKSISGIHTLTVVSIMFNFVTIVLIICFILGIFPLTTM